MFRDLQSELMHQRARGLADQACRVRRAARRTTDPPAARPHLALRAFLGPRVGFGLARPNPKGRRMTTATFVTNQGSFTVTLMPEHAPKTVANFVDLATGGREWTEPRHDVVRPALPGTIFHRVIDGFMIQGGDPEGTGRGGPGYTFEDEVPADGPTFNQVGRLAMANAGPARTARSSSSRSARRRG